MVTIHAVSDIYHGMFDCVVVINDGLTGFAEHLALIENSLLNFKQYHPKLEKSLTVVPFDAHPSKKLIFSPIVSLIDDCDDSRRIYEAANEGIKKVIELGLRRPVLVLGQLNSLPKGYTWASEVYIHLNVLLGALFGVYVPLEIREDIPQRSTKLDTLAVYGISEKLVTVAAALEEGRRIARDIGGSDPERMAAPRIAEYLEKEFNNTCIKVQIERVDKTKYPLMEAVNRGAAAIPRHDGRVVKFQYDSNDEPDETLFLVGKGITYDSGGMNIKISGAMTGMHRDKCSAAAVAGFFKCLDILKPKGLKAYGFCPFVRNSVGPDAYVADEIITSRANRRVRIGNTDAEGRMVMADLLCEAKEMALLAKNPSLFTIATLTRHVRLAYGIQYTAVLGNGCSIDRRIPQILKDTGDNLSEPVEISTIRREDIEAHRGYHEYDDVLQAQNLPSHENARGHQKPAGFLLLASGLDEHGRNSSHPLTYTHVDCAGSVGRIGSLPTGAPLLMLAGTYILPRVI